MNKDLYNLIGLAKKAGAICSGTTACENEVRHGKVYLVLLDRNSSQNTVKDFTNLCKYYKINLILLEDEDALGESIGKYGIKVVGIKDENLAREIINKVNSIPGEK